MSISDYSATETVVKIVQLEPMARRGLTNPLSLVYLATPVRVPTPGRSVRTLVWSCLPGTWGEERRWQGSVHAVVA